MQSFASVARRSFATSSRRFEKQTLQVVENTADGLAKKEELETTPAGVVSGAPDELLHRPVRIFRPSPPSTQSAKYTSHHWRVDWDTLGSGGRWENRLIGWASSADYLQGTHIKFASKDAAIRFCEKQGYPYYVQEPNVQKFVPKTYAHNYTYHPGKLRIHHTK